MAPFIGRRVLTLEDPPGARVVVGPWQADEFQDWLKLDPNADLVTMLTMWKLFAAHIESHPFDVDDAGDLDAVVGEAIIRAWTKVAFGAMPAVHGPRH